MKLHLPVGLRTALLAALASFSVAFGQITVKQGITEESEGSDVEVTDGTLNDTTLQGDVLIEVTGPDGDATLSLSGNIGISQDATTTITVGEGGEIKTTGRLIIGTAGSLQEDPGKESVTTINVNGGKFDASKGSSLVIGWGDGQDSVSKTTISVSNNGSFILGEYCTIGDTYRRNSHSETVINVTSGGTFRNNKGYIGRSGWSTAFDSPHTTTTVNTITVEGDGSRFIDTGYGVGSAEGNALEARTTINVKKGGTYTTRPDASEQYKYPSGNLAIAKTKGNAVVLTINLEDGNFLFDGDIAHAANDNTSSEATITLSGESHFEITGSVVTGGGIGAGSWQSPESTVSINVQAGSTFTIASSSYNGLGYVTGSTKDATIKVGIEIDDGTFEITGKSHAFIGTINADEWSSPSGEAEVKISVHGSEKGKGKFNMETGELSWKGTSVESHTTLDVDLTGYAEMTITGGKIGGDEGEATIDLYDNATLTLTTPNENISEHLVVTLHDGNLGAGFTGNKVAIDTAEGFTGTIDLGGLDGGKVDKLKINEAGTRVTGLQTGTTLILTENQEGGYDNFIMVGTDSAYLKTGSERAPEGYGALIEFKDESGTVKLKSGTQITLDFSGKLVGDVLKGVENGEVQIEVWFTSGSLTFGEGGEDPDKFFKIGDGWGLYDTTVTTSEDEATGKLLITGNIYNVWASMKQLTKKDESGALVGDLSSVKESFTKVVIDADTKLDSTADGGRLEQLEGDCNLHITGSGEVNLDNSEVTVFPTETLDSTLKGTLTTDKNVNLRKNGEGMLTLKGGLRAGGDLTVAQGVLTIDGEDNSIAGKLGMEKGGTLQVEKELTLSGTSELSEGKLSGNGTITVAEEGNLTVGNSEVLDKGLSLKVDGNLTLRGEQQRGTEEGEGAIIGSGTLIVDEEGQLSTGSHLNMEVSGIDVKGTLSQEGGQIAANDIVVEEGGKYELKTGTITSKGDGRLSLQVAGAFEVSGGEVTSGSITLNGSANLTQSNGTIKDSSISLKGGATMTQTGGEVTGGTLELNDGANLTQSDGTIKDSSISLKGGATMTQDGGQITGGSLDLSGGATLTQSNGTINGGSITLSGEDTGFTQEGGSIGKDATFSLNDGATLTLRGGGMNAAVTMEGEASLYDLGNQVAEGSSITMQGGSLANAGNYAGKLTIQTDATYTGALDLGGVDAARITQVQIEASGTELRNLKSGSTLTFRAGDEMVVGEQHVVYRGGQTESAGGTMVQFQDGKGQIAFGEAGKLQLRLENKILKDIEGQLEILFTNGSFSGMPEGGQKELEAWLKEHFVLETGLDGIKVLLLSDAEGGHLILTGSTEGVWIASRNGQNVDVADLLNNYSAVIADEDLTLTLPTTQEETPTTIVHQLRSDKETHGDFIVKTESGATAGHTVQLHNENTDTDGANGDTNFYGNIRVEGTGLEAATLEKTGDAALNVHGNLESSGTVQVKEGTLALGGTANSIGTLAMSGGKLQVDGALELTGATEMSEESRGSISGEGSVKLGSGASLTLAGGVSYEVQNTQLENGAQMSQKGEAAIKGGSIKLSGEGTGYTQASGTISGATFTLTEGASFSQAGGSIDGGAAFSLSDGANLTQSNGTINDTSVTLSGEGTGYTQASGTISGATFTLMEGASFAQAGGSIDGGAAFSLSDGANLTQSKGAIDDASITLSGSASMRQDGGQITGGTLELSGGATMTQSNGTINGTSVALSGEGTSYTQAGGSIGEGAKFSLSDGAKLTLSGGSMNGAVTMEGRTSRYDLGNQAAQGSITMHGGSLANAGNYAGKLAIQTSDTYTGALDLGGVDAARITSIQLAGKDTYLTGLKEGSTLTLHTDNSFKVTEQNAWVDGKGGPEGKQAFFQFGTAGAGEVGTGSVVDVASGKKITLNFVGQQIAEAAREDGGITLNVWITNGQLGGGKSGEAAVTWAEEHFVIGTGWGLKVESYDAAQGMLVLKGQSNIWDARVNGDQVAGHAEAKASELGSVGKVVIDENTVVTVDQDATIHQLDGEGEYSLELKNDGEDDKTITLHNQSTSESALGSTGDTVFGGDILAGEGVNLQKTGDAALAVQGSLKAEGDVTVEKGELVLGEAGEHSIGGELSLGEDGTLQVDGSLTLSGTSELREGKLSGGGTIEVSGKDASLTFGDERMADDSELKFKAVDGGTLNYTGSVELELTDLTGNGHYKGGSSFHVNGNGEEQVFEGTVEGSLSLEEGNFNLTNPGNGSCDLYVVGKDTQATIAPGSSYHSITVGDNVHDNDKLIVSADAEGNKAGAGIRVTGNIVFRNGAETDFTLNLNDPDLWGSGDHDATMLSTTRTIYIEQGTTFVIDCLESNLSGTHDNLRNVVILEGANIENPKDYDANAPMIARILVSDALSENTREGEKEVVKANVHLGTILDQLYENVTMTKDEQKVYINADARTESPWMTYATTSNSGAGLNLLWKALSNAGGAVDPQVEGMFHALQNLLNESPAEAQRVMAAIAGSTLTSVSAAQSAALRNQTSRVRDHALQAARLRCAGNEEATQQQRPCKTTHVWVEGTSFFSEQHSIGDESGYRLNSWGGAVGIDAQVNAHWSVGLSLAANYGDLEARAADYAKGDLDSYYVSAWSQAKNGRWGNTLLFTVGTNEADLRRTVNYGAGSYTATSNASGSSLGAMWELTCDFHPVKENKSNILQPLFNVAVQHTSMDGFSEKNAGGVGLATEKQTRDTMTLGLGLRWLAAIDSAKAVNRTVSTELHANVAQDLGDRRSVANVALLTDPNFTQSVYGSKTGSTAFQFGAGVNVPMTPNSCIYVNAGGELREHANTWSATLGVRMGF